MGRELKRVPMDFDYPLKKVWYGYQIGGYCHEDYNEGCLRCKEFARIMKIPTDGNCPNFKEHFNLNLEPPKGDGYQLWETTSEGSPASPVFKTLDELCEWCADNATTFASFKATKEQWLNMLGDDFVYQQIGNAIFL